jgi:hypothetical protein
VDTGENQSVTEKKNCSEIKMWLPEQSLELVVRVFREAAKSFFLFDKATR